MVDLIHCNSINDESKINLLEDSNDRDTPHGRRCELSVHFYIRKHLHENKTKRSETIIAISNHALNFQKLPKSENLPHLYLRFKSKLQTANLKHPYLNQKIIFLYMGVFLFASYDQGLSI